MIKSAVEERAINYLKANKKQFFEHYIIESELETTLHKTAIFTAGASGAGKTEYAVDRKLKEPFLLHIDIDSVRDFFISVGYNGTNASDYQRPSAKGVNWLFDKATKKGYSLVMDSNFAVPETQQKNIERLLAKEYLIEINYIFRELSECYSFAKDREAKTKRRVPMSVVESTFKNSFDTTLFIKKTFSKSIILNLFDAKNNEHYKDIDENRFFELISKEIL